MTPEEMLTYLKASILEFTERHDVKFYCDCSKEKVKRAPTAISDKDLQDIVKMMRILEVMLFCNTAAKFSIAGHKRHTFVEENRLKFVRNQ